MAKKKFKLTASNYYSKEANERYFSVSQYKTFLDCPARAMAEIRGEYKEKMTIAMLIGSYVDSYFEGTLEEFKKEHPEVFNISVKEKEDTIINVQKIAPEMVTKNLTWKPTALAAAKKRFPDLFDIVYSLKADFQKAEEIIKRIESDELFMEYMSGEKQIVMTAELFGAPWKIKMDSYKKGKFIDDLKVIRSLERIMGKSFVEHWSYDLQLALYSKVEALNTGEDRLPTYLSVATKEDDIDIELVEVPFWRHDECLSDVEKNMPRFIAYKSGELEAPRCGTCAYCRRTKKLKAPISFEIVGFSNKELALMEGKIF